jgi:hypothetical protein
MKNVLVFYKEEKKVSFSLATVILTTTSAILSKNSEYVLLKQSVQQMCLEVVNFNVNLIDFPMSGSFIPRNLQNGLFI